MRYYDPDGLLQYISCPVLIVCIHTLNFYKFRDKVFAINYLIYISK